MMMFWLNSFLSIRTILKRVSLNIRLVIINMIRQCREDIYFCQHL